MSMVQDANEGKDVSPPELIRTFRLCAPSARPVAVNGAVQAAYAAPSIEHVKSPVAELVKPMFADVEFVVAEGAPVSVGAAGPLPTIALFVSAPPNVLSVPPPIHIMVSSERITMS